MELRIHGYVYGDMLQNAREYGTYYPKNGIFEVTAPEQGSFGLDGSFQNQLSEFSIIGSLSPSTNRPSADTSKTFLPTI